MKIERVTTVVVKDDDGAVIPENTEILFLMNNRTHLAVFLGIDMRSRIVLKDTITGEDYRCLPESISRVTVFRRC